MEKNRDMEREYEGNLDPKDKKGLSSMHISSSSADARPNSEKAGVAVPAVSLSEGSLVTLALVRLFFGLLWFQQLFWKLPPGFTGLHRYVVTEGQYTFLPGYAYVIQHILLPNFLLLGAFTWTAELVVALSLLFGILSRFGALLALVLSVQLFVGLAVAPGEWYWTYGMLVLLSLTLAAVPAGRRLGVDQWLAVRLENAATRSQLVRVLRWFV